MNKNLLKKINISTEKFFGYTYAGLLAAFCFTLINPERSKELFESLGSIVSLIVIFGFGVCIYTFYFRVIGDFFIFPFQHLIHRLFDLIRGYRNDKYTCSISYLGYLGVPFGLRRAAYEEIKFSFFNKEDRNNIHLAHGELHILYLTSIELGFTFFYLLINNQKHEIILIISLVCYLACLIGDTRQHSLEVHLIKSLGEKRIKEFLTERGFIKKPDGQRNL